MRRCTLLCLTAVLLLSCSDKESPTAPDPTIDPSFEVTQENQAYNATRITTLIRAIEPPTGQLNATEKRWESIQRQMAMGELDAAQEQMLALADKAVDFYEKGNLLVLEPGDPVLPESTAEAVAELVMRLFVYVGFHAIDAAGRYPGFYLVVTDAHPDFFYAVFDGLDSGFGIAEPDESVLILTEHEWAAVQVPAGAVGESVFISIELLDLEFCNTNSGLIEAGGCWSINRVPEGDFLAPVTVETCVDPNPVPLELEPLILLHKVDEDSGEITALPWADASNITCPDPWPEEGAETMVAGDEARGSLLRSFGNGLARFLLPKPLAAWLQRRPPIGIGGLTGSFTDFFGAVPEGASEGLLSWWSADGHYFDMYGSSQGEPIGSVPFVPGVSEEAFDLSGSGTEVLVQPLSNEIRELQDLTVAAWVYLNPTGPARIQRFVTVGGGGDKAVLRQESGGNRMLDFFMHFEDAAGIQHVYVDNAFQTECFHFFAGTYGDDFMRAYLDGVEVGSLYVPPVDVIYGSDHAKFGASGGPGFPAEEMDGYVDEVMVFDRALGSSEIQALYDLGEGNLCTPGAFPVTYPEVTVDPTYVGGDPTIVPTLAEAMTLVHPGGTVWMADGTHVAEDVPVDKPVTIDEVPGATAIIRNDAGQRSLHIDGMDSGVVTIRNLDFINNVPDGAYPGLRTSSIEAKGTYADVVIEDNSFTNEHPNAQSSVRADVTSVAGAEVMIRRNTFTGGRTGIVATGAVDTTDPFVTVASNDFTDIRGAVVFQTDADGVVFDNDIADGIWHCITFLGSSNGVISQNRLTNCGIYGGIRVFEGLVEVVDNEITDDEVKPSGWDEATDPYHAAIRFSDGADGSVHGNTIDGCGWGGCIQVSYGATASVFDNEITAYQGAGTEFGILTFGGYVPAEANPPTVSITDNTVTGVGFGDGPADRHNQLSYGITEGALLVRNATVVEFSGNRVDSVNWGIDIYENGTIEAGIDNVVNFAYGAITSALNGQIEMTQNDFTDWIVSIRDGDGTLNGSVTCNWWGDAFGPTGNDFPPGGSPVVYSPWADGPVANSGGGSCSLASIGGSVLLDGEPVAGAGVTIAGPETRAMSTGAGGNYLFSNILPGSYTVTLSPYPGEYPVTTRVVNLVPGEAETVEFSGADLPYSAPPGTGTAVSWFMAEPAAAVGLCNGEGLDPCLTPDLADVTLIARATGSTGTFANPFSGGYVYFYFWDLALGRFRFIDRVPGNLTVVTDSGTGPEGRAYNWSITVSINGDGILPGLIHVTAVGVDSSNNAYLMPVVNSNITVVDGSIVGEDK